MDVSAKARRWRLDGRESDVESNHSAIRFPGRERASDSKADLEAAYAGTQEMGRGWQSSRWKPRVRGHLKQRSLQLHG